MHIKMWQKISIQSQSSSLRRQSYKTNTSSSLRRQIVFCSLVFLGSLFGNVDILSPADRVLLSGLPGLAGR